VEAFWGDPRGR